MDFSNQSSGEDFKKESTENAERARGMTLRAARVNKNNTIDDEEVHRVVKLTQTFPHEQLQAMGKDDILSRALGVPKHPGRGTTMDDASETVGDSNTRGTGATHHVYARPATLHARAKLVTLHVRSRWVTLHTKSLPPGHHKASIDVVQLHKEDSPLPVPIEDENLMTIRDAIGTYVAWPRSLINLPPRVPPPLSKGMGKEHFQTKESITSPMKGSVHRTIPEEFAGAEGILTFKNLRIMVHGDMHVHVVENTYSKVYWGKEFKDEIGTDEIIEVTRHRVFSGSFLCFYISYLCEAYLHNTGKASKFSFISPIELEEKKTVNRHIVQALQRYANQDHLVLVTCNVGDHWVFITINTSDETVYYTDPLRQHYMK
ncbi:Papain-like cysteine peptidase superfamily [Sesbania bispinosa]|nr:Papain-like cysteine peptidase superfamily [Sesbania bispinosa]